MQGVVPGGDGDGSAFHVQRCPGIYRIVDRGVNVQRQLPDGQESVPRFLGGGTGLDAVLALCLNIQGARAAQKDLRTVLALDDGVFSVGVSGLAVIFRRIGQGVFRSVVDQNGHLGAFSADNGGSAVSGEVQSVQHQRNTGGALFHLYAAVRAAAGEQIGAGLRNGHGRAFRFNSPGGGGGDTGVRKCDACAIGNGDRGRSGGDGCGRAGSIGASGCGCGTACQQAECQYQRKNGFLKFHKISPCRSFAGMPQEISRFPLRHRMASSNCFSCSGAFSRTR